VAVPPGTSKGVVQSQVLDRFGSLCAVKIVYVADALFASKFPALASARVSWGDFLFHLIFRRQNVILYSRSAQQVLLLIIVRFVFRCQLEVSFDVRGFQAEESAFRRGGASGLRYNVLSSVERFAVMLADTVTCVSNNMRNEILSRYGRPEVQVIPCCIVHAKVKRRFATDGSDGGRKLRFAYVGSIVAWQCFEESVVLYKSLAGEKTLVVVTPDVERATAVLKKNGVAATVTSGGWDVVSRVLDESDFGFVLRRESVVNATASPIKFLEYTGSGVIPVCTEFVGDYSSIFRSCVHLVGVTSVLSRGRLVELLCQEVYDELYKKTSLFVWEQHLDSVKYSITPKRNL